ncbi:MAG: hypothetical protein ABJE66_04560 [Deltaproteobacteria bacterium]
MKLWAPRAITADDLVEQRLGGPAADDGVGDLIGVALPRITAPAGRARTLALLDHVGALVGCQAFVGGIAERDAMAGRERAGADLIAGLTGGAARECANG